MRTRNWLLLGVLGLSVFPAGCSGQVQKGPAPTAEAPGGAEKEPAAPNQPADQVPAERKIIYTATLDVIVDNIDTARQQLDQLVNDTHGFYEKSDFGGGSGSRRAGSWTVRVPVDQFPKFVSAVAAFGVAQTNRTEAQDVTAEYVDVQTQVDYYRAELKRLSALLDKAQSIADILKVREQVAKVQLELNRVEARQRTLSRLTALSTVNVMLREIKDYVPPTAPTFGTMISRTWNDSLEALEKFGKALVIAAVAIVPWLPLIALAGLGLFLLRRRRRAGVGGSHAGPA